MKIKGLVDFGDLSNLSIFGDSDDSRDLFSFGDSRNLVEITEFRDSRRLRDYRVFEVSFSLMGCGDWYTMGFGRLWRS